MRENGGAKKPRFKEHIAGGEGFLIPWGPLKISQRPSLPTVSGVRKSEPCCLRAQQLFYEAGGAKNTSEGGWKGKRNSSLVTRLQMWRSELFFLWSQP